MRTGTLKTEYQSHMVRALIGVTCITHGAVVAKLFECVGGTVQITHNAASHVLEARPVTSASDDVTARYTTTTMASLHAAQHQQH